MFNIIIAGQPHTFALRCERYADGGASCVDVAIPGGDGGTDHWCCRITDNPYPHARALIAEHFYLRPDWETATPVIQAMIREQIIEPVPGGQQLPDGRRAHRLGFGILPDLDTRVRR